MNQFIRFLWALNLGLITITTLTYCTKASEVVEQDQNVDVASEEQSAGKIFCPVTFVADNYVSVCGSRSNTNPCTTMGMNLVGTEFATSGTYTPIANTPIVFSNLIGVGPIDLTISGGNGNTSYHIYLWQGQSVCATMIGGCNLYVGSCD